MKIYKYTYMYIFTCMHQYWGSSKSEINKEEDRERI